MSFFFLKSGLLIAETNGEMEHNCKLFCLLTTAPRFYSLFLNIETLWSLLHIITDLSSMIFCRKANNENWLKMSFKMGSSISKSTMKKSGSSKNNSTTTNKFSVLVVDDDLVIQRIHKVFLNRFGFETQVVGNGKEAVDLYRSGASFHLVLMDMEMPIMDGPKVCFFLSFLHLFIFILFTHQFFILTLNSV